MSVWLSFCKCSSCVFNSCFSLLIGNKNIILNVCVCVCVSKRGRIRIGGGWGTTQKKKFVCDICEKLSDVWKGRKWHLSSFVRRDAGDWWKTWWKKLLGFMNTFKNRNHTSMFICFNWQPDMSVLQFKEHYTSFTCQSVMSSLKIIMMDLHFLFWYHHSPCSLTIKMNYQDTLMLVMLSKIWSRYSLCNSKIKKLSEADSYTN